MQGPHGRKELMKKVCAEWNSSHMQTKAVSKGNTAENILLYTAWIGDNSAISGGDGQDA